MGVGDGPFLECEIKSKDGAQIQSCDTSWDNGGRTRSVKHIPELLGGREIIQIRYLDQTRIRLVDRVPPDHTAIEQVALFPYPLG